MPQIIYKSPRVLGLRGDLRAQIVHALPQDTGRLAIRRPACHGVAHGLLTQQIPAGDALHVGLTGRLRDTLPAERQEQQRGGQQADHQSAF